MLFAVAARLEDIEDHPAEQGYRDHIGALQRFRVERPREVEVLSFPAAPAVLKRLRGLAPMVILSDGDVFFQPRKVEHAGIFEAVDGHVLIYIHKEEALDDVERRYPAEHYVLVDDELRILTAVERYWGERVTTVFPRQGTFANDPQVLGAFPPADLSIDRIADLLDYDPRELRLASRPPHPA